MARLAFFGTPAFAAASLEALKRFCDEHGHEIAFVVCQPDKPVGRGQQMSEPATKTCAKRLGITVKQPMTLKRDTAEGDTFFYEFQQANITLAVVVAYGKIIPKRLLDTPRLGFINVHASLLPRWRGASPIQHAIWAGDKETGISIMALVPELDAGDVYYMEKMPILESDTSGTLTQQLAKLGGDVLTKSLPGILAGTLTKTPQDIAHVTFAGLLKKEDGHVNLGSTSEAILRQIRAMQPWPGAFLTHKGKTIKIFNARPGQPKRHAKPGTILGTSVDGIEVSTQDGSILLDDIQLQDKRRMPVSQLLNGYSIQVGDSLE